ncbi:MAG: hypothetical protein LBJ69_01090 [Holosporales bacterium]|nr:hypothetical protein [Holosporales bacterium]
MKIRAVLAVVMIVTNVVDGARPYRSHSLVSIKPQPLPPRQSQANNRTPPPSNRCDEVTATSARIAARRIIERAEAGIPNATNYPAMRDIYDVTVRRLLEVVEADPELLHEDTPPSQEYMMAVLDDELGDSTLQTMANAERNWIGAHIAEHDAGRDTNNPGADPILRETHPGHQTFKSMMDSLKWGFKMCDTCSVPFIRGALMHAWKLPGYKGSDLLAIALTQLELEQGVLLARVVKDEVTYATAPGIDSCPAIGVVHGDRDNVRQVAQKYLDTIPVPLSAEVPA